MLRERLLAAALVALCAATPRDAGAGVLGRNRFHVLRRPARGARPFAALLKRETRRNLRGIGLYHRAGTGPERADGAPRSWSHARPMARRWS